MKTSQRNNQENSDRWQEMHANLLNIVAYLDVTIEECDQRLQAVEKREQEIQDGGHHGKM